MTKARDTSEDKDYGELRGWNILTKEHRKLRISLHKRVIKAKRMLWFLNAIRLAWISQSTYQDFVKDSTRGGNVTLNKLDKFVKDYLDNK